MLGNGIVSFATFHKALRFFVGQTNNAECLIPVFLHSVNACMKKLQEYVDDINSNIEKLDTRGPVSRYVLPEENIKGRFVIFVLAFGRTVSSICCRNIDSLFQAYNNI